MPSLNPVAVRALVFVLCSCIGRPSLATWSLAAVDRESGEVGIAGASCTHNVQGIGEVIPGVGAVIVQAMSNDDAREWGMEQLQNGASPAQIVQGMRDARFDPENQQYAVVSLDPEHEPAAYSGAENAAWRGALTDDGVVVSGNILTGPDVLRDAMDAFAEHDGSLTEKLVAGLTAGAAAGGDQRCGEQHARSAFVTVYKQDDPGSTPWFHLVVYGAEKGGEPAVDRLVEEFAELYPRSEGRTTTRVYVIPTARP